VSAVCAGSALIFHGSPESDTWQVLQDSAWLIDDSDDSTLLNNIKDAIAQASNVALLKGKKVKAQSVREKLYQGEVVSMKDISATISNLLINNLPL
jgi:hypothetical protein